MKDDTERNEVRSKRQDGREERSGVRSGIYGNNNSKRGNGEKSTEILGNRANDNASKKNSDSNIEHHSQKQHFSIDLSTDSEGRELTPQQQKHIDNAIEEFGTLNGNTKKWSRAGYITSDGKVLDFGMPGRTGGYRVADHRDIGSVYEDEYEFDSATDQMLQFMSEGNIRVIPESMGLDFCADVEPTKEQYDRAKLEYRSTKRRNIQQMDGSF